MADPEYSLDKVDFGPSLMDLYDTSAFPSQYPTAEKDAVPLGDAPFLHDEILEICRKTGIGFESIAREAGLIQNGEIPELKDYAAPLSVSSQTNENKPVQTPTTKPTDSKDLNGTPAGPGNARRKKTTTPVEDEEADSQTPNGVRKRRRSNKPSVDKAGKGLRHFSLRVCQKVEEKRNTTYNEVADALVEEFNASPEKLNSPVDQKNIRRRVYDALNVLMAMGIISKEKKEIRWIGLPANSKQELVELEDEKVERMERVQRKKEHLQELLTQQHSYQNLLLRNRRPEYLANEARINLPFIIVHTKSQTKIECEVSEDRTEYFFDFSLPFEIHDDTEILKRMGLGKSSGVAQAVAASHSKHSPAGAVTATGHTQAPSMPTSSPLKKGVTMEGGVFSPACLLSSSSQFHSPLRTSTTTAAHSPSGLTSPSALHYPSPISTS